MPRVQRWSHINHSFAGGVLSPASQDQVDSDLWLQGAAEIVNFEIQRDGGLTGRPPFVRSGYVFDVLRYSAVKVAEDATETNGDGRAGHLQRLERTALDEGRPVVGVDGVHALRAYGQVDVGAVSVPLTLYEVDLQEQESIGVGAEANRGVRFVVWHDVTCTQPADAPGWKAEDGAGIFQPVFKAELNIGVEQGSTGAVAAAGWIDANTLALAEERVNPRGDWNEFSWGAFAPGRVARDIIVPAQPIATAHRERNVVGARIVLAQTRGPSPFELTIGGFSAYTFHRSTGARLLRRVNFDQEPVRIISWVLGRAPLALVLSQTRVQAFLVTVDGVLRDTPDLEGSWFFTARQLRELTWTIRADSIILAHRDFPYPLEVRAVGQGQLAVGYMSLENIPEITVPAGTEARERLTLVQPVPVDEGDDGYC